MDELGAMFARAAADRFQGSSPRYEVLARAVAQRPWLAEPLLAAPAHRRAPALLFAAVQLLLRGPAKGHELAGYLPTLSGYRTPDDAMVRAFEALVREHRAALVRICATRQLQTNEPRRCTALFPAFDVAARQFPGRRLGLVELGASAGLLLIDGYSCRYQDGAAAFRLERPGALAPLTLDCLLLGEGRPAFDRPLPDFVSRIGVDIAPLDPCSPDTGPWLASCVWPDHLLRLGRLTRALAIAREHPPTLVAADMVDGLPGLIDRVDSEVVPCVFASSAVSWLPPDRRVALRRTIEEIGRRRSLVVILDEPPTAGFSLFTTDPPEPISVDAAKHGPAVGLVTMVTFDRGTPTLRALGWSGPHGAWLAWRPHEHSYSPPEQVDAGRIG